MSVNFTGVTFPNQKVTPAYDAIIRRALLDDGILTGCALSYSGSTLTMAAGQLMICGRQIIHPSSQNWAVTEATTGYARLVLTIDLTRTSTKDTFDQVVEEIQYATAVNGFVDLEQSDINASGSRYQIAACVVSLGPGGITGIVSKLDMTEGGGAGGILTVTTQAGVAVTVSNDDKTNTKTADADGVAVFKGLSSGIWAVTITDGEKTATKSVAVITDYSTVISFSTIPEFTYTGDYEVVDDADNPITTGQGNWKIRFLTSGVFTPTELRGAGNGIDVFLVGAGGGSTSHAVGGCGGGYTRTGMAIHITPNTQYEITIGAGGTGGDGGSTSGFNLTAAGGKGIATPHSGGLDGGSGGAGLDVSGSSVGGSDGANGTTSKAGGGKGQIALPGPNGETGSTREFGERWGRLYASGGSGGGLDTTGPDGGGGGYKQSGKENTGGGGGARYSDSDPDTHGGSGIVIIRNHREVTE